MSSPNGYNYKQNSYYDRKTFRMTPSMLRARRPYFWKNLAGLFIVGSIPVGIYAYTFNFLHQDDFADVPIPPISEEELTRLKKEYEASKN
ncbi:hypothetical protein BABINDRAFT_6552 [Babjeviella inositovora NRRL Y-12698]|uniref:Cytochrome c oxidase assembly factor 3 n=1 Tax=Babjeviella inositovora NRRL Y-12698 TaxID=984486 RepID=A0A1E3QW82_9ASCO|nr:uncharacterized protein BABINDRAFT_6552 [Babjeviella inositovora NRRL Y-12698]ODQ81923.1 hypothetical protein BABINDRAFT_6552 [Babjeviella inositovora NRRL Y-12698]